MQSYMAKYMDAMVKKMSAAQTGMYPMQMAQMAGMLPPMMPMAPLGQMLPQ